MRWWCVDCVIGAVAESIDVGGVNISICSYILRYRLIKISVNNGGIIHRMNKNFDNLEVGLIKVVSYGNGKVVITKEMVVWEVGPVSVGWINGCTTMRWWSVDCVIGTVAESIDVGCVNVSMCSYILRYRLIKISVNNGGVFSWVDGKVNSD